jgi:hypothetical protein
VIGNTTAIAGMIITFSEETKQLLIIKGNWLQAVGGIYELEKNNENNERNNYDGQSLDVYGSWIQAVGSVISAIDQTKKG